MPQTKMTKKMKTTDISQIVECKQYKLTKGYACQRLLSMTDKQ